MTKRDVLEEALRLWNRGRYDAATKYYRKYGISDALFSKYLVNSMIRTESTVVKKEKKIIRAVQKPISTELGE